MSDRPTTKTDAAIISSNGQWSFVLKETCCRLERERDEAREALENYTESTIHTCNDECQRPMCVLRRHNEELQQVIKTLRSCIRYDNQRIDELEEKINELRTKNN